jgi:beta-phosphoglucomutase
MIKALLFDMDGTLADNMGYHARAWIEFLRRNGVILPDAQAQRRIQGTIGEVIARFFPEVTSPEQVHRLGQEKERLYRELYSPQLAEIPGLTRFLNKARSRGLHIGLATMGDQPNIDFILDGLGIRTCFDVITGSEQISNGKPDPEIFKLTLDRLGATTEECVIFEDSYAGIEAARRLGARVIGIESTHSRTELIESGCPETIADYRELLLDDLLQG